MIDHSSMITGGLALVKRAAAGGGFGEHYDIPPLVFLTVALSSLVFLPAFFYVGYTLKAIYPTLAMVEDPSPPGYEPLATGEEADGAAVSVPADETKAVTSSLRATDRLIRSLGGWRSNFRGLLCALAVTFATVFAAGVFGRIPFVPGFVGSLLALLAAAQLHTAWVHIVISNPSPLPFWKRLPPFRKTLEATWAPILAYWLALTLATWLPALLGVALNLPSVDLREPHKIPQYEHSMAWKGALVFLLLLLFSLFAVMPANVVLVRVQASLLPPEDDPIVPFDRSFGGAVEPVIVGGKGYVSWRDALRTFPRSSWIRLYVLYAKVFLIYCGVWFLWAVVVTPQIVLTSRKTVEDN